MASGARSVLSFVRTAVLEAQADGSGFGEEKAVEHTDVKHSVGTRLEEISSTDAKKPRTALDIDREKLDKREAQGSLSLFDQLKSNKDKQDEEWKATHDNGGAEKVLDEDEVHFLLEHRDKSLAKERRENIEVQDQISAFTKAQKRQTDEAFRKAAKAIAPPTAANDGKLASAREYEDDVHGKEVQQEDGSEEEEGDEGDEVNGGIVLVARKRKKKKSKKSKSDKKSKKAKSALVDY